MEETGIYTDINDLRQMQSEIQGKLDLLISNIHEAVGKNLTLTPKQLGVVLFETLELPVIKTKLDILLQLMCWSNLQLNN